MGKGRRKERIIIDRRRHHRRDGPQAEGGKREGKDGETRGDTHTNKGLWMIRVQRTKAICITKAVGRVEREREERGGERKRVVIGGEVAEERAHGDAAELAEGRGRAQRHHHRRPRQHQQRFQGTRKIKIPLFYHFHPTPTPPPFFSWIDLWSSLWSDRRIWMWRSWRPPITSSTRPKSDILGVSAPSPFAFRLPYLWLMKRVTLDLYLFWGLAMVGCRDLGCHFDHPPSRRCSLLHPRPC